jgi:hypothetical protein
LEDGRCYIQKGNDRQFIEYDKLLNTSTLVETKLQEIGITDAAAIRQIKNNLESMTYEEAISLFFSRGGKRYKTRKARKVK